MTPIQFTPILKPVIWGGSEICRFKSLAAKEDGIGESWEISGVEGNVSIVANGVDKGKTLDELIASYGDELLGKAVFERFGNTFPLLIKFIDAKQALSIQVHPNDELARKRHSSFGKTEMWYVIQADKGASLYAGFKEEMNAEKYLQSLADDTFIHSLQKHEVQSGDVFFLPAGRVHAIGAGCFIAEIQQTSNITYRIYDYNRKDADGNPRELHTELAKDAIDYKVYPDYKTDYQKDAAEIQTLAACPYFTTNLISGKQGEKLQHLIHDGNSFVIFICLSGKLQLADNKKNTVEIGQGETVLIPAANSSSIQFLFEEDSRLLETFIE
ncbi:MAG: class I mannose-6-phosphate isomerase [Candidatus Symbiothrix sp.]|jgi:mannose-6-phosphate isomerase|nr:class I mannose-6-phosphate isomerase [Candidatus Symbiothrix sp.]